MDNAGYVVAGYLLTAMSVSGYVAHLLLRARRARSQAVAIAAERREGR